MSSILARRPRRLIARYFAQAFIGGAGIVWGASVAAQSASDSTVAPIRLSTMLDAAERANPMVGAARALARAAAARVPGASVLPDPQLQLGFMNYELRGLRPMPTLGMVQLQLMEMVPLAGKLALAGRVEAARAEAVAARIPAATFEVRTRTAMAFYDLYAADGAIAVMRSTRRTLQDVADIALRMYEVGDGRQPDVLRASVELARMDEEIIRMETMRSSMRSRLNALLVQPDAAPVGTPLLPVFPSSPLSIDSLTRLAEEHRPAIRAGMREVDAASAAERLAHREIWPDLQVGIQLARQSGPMGPQGMGSLMLGVSLPLFAESRQYRMRDEASAMRQMAAAELANTRVETRGAIAEAYANLMRARRLAELYRSSVLPQAGATVTSSLTAYRAGTVNFMTLLDAQMTLNRFLQELFTLEADEGKAWADLEMLTGQVLVDAQTARPARSVGGSDK